MQRQDFAFDLPPELIAQAPPDDRAGGRLLVLPSEGGHNDRNVRDLPEQLQPGDLLVLNDSRVIRARLTGHKASGGRAEILLERLLGPRRARAFVRASNTPGEGAQILLPDQMVATVAGRDGGLFLLDFSADLLEFTERHGDIPLPPYIQRQTDDSDDERYQTVYANAPGSVAAPTAGLHFDDALLAALDARGVRRATVTLHVGAGTFEPVRVDDVAEHRMHSEYAVLSEATAEAIRQTRADGGRVIAVGTTSLRTLESAAISGEVRAFDGETDIFITPGWTFRGIDGLMTNFHLPESTLMMLVCALGGHQRMLEAYRHAVDQRYRFFSYGDAMLIWPSAT
ncbi:MAG: tRNA preQ1(34) S-adenosylmethionine ribosyltransferase-isomerase QueA [Pseudomonadota bacterium]